MTSINENNIDEKYNDKLNRVIQLHKEFKNIHHSLEKLYPIAIAEKNTVYVFDIKEGNDTYEFIMKQDMKMNIPKGIKAAMDLDFYENKAAAVVSGDTFDTDEGYCFLFHEFVHCYQFYNCDIKIKSRLSVYKEEIEKKNYIWEITYPFPYDNIEVKNLVLNYASILRNKELHDILHIRQELKHKLKKQEYEYMTWQEWKEGFARFIENKLRETLGVKENRNRNIEKIDRVVFYELGNRFFEKVEKQNDEMLKHIEDLFYILYNNEIVL